MLAQIFLAKIKYMFSIIKSKTNLYNRFTTMLRRLYSTLLEAPAAVSPEVTTIKSGSLTGTFGVKHLESLDWLHTLSPCFPLCAEQIEIITEPQAFYNRLLTLCTNATERISIASLYFGTGKLETQLVTEIQNNVQRNADLKVNILIDYTRGTRGTNNTTSKSMLQTLVNQSKNVLLSLYHTPNLRGLTRRIVPARWNELIGLQHMKVYVTDHTVIISGANLSNDYFTNRQDRYIVIKDQNLSDFYFELIEKVQEFSLKVLPNSKCGLHPNWNIVPYKGNRNEFVAQAKDSICEVFANTVDNLQDQINCKTDATKIDTWIFPLVEMGQLNIHHDSIVTQRIFSDALPDSRLNLTTGYFNLTQTYMDTLANECKANCDILMAHPNANGFQGASGPAGGIPAAYSQIAKTFYQKLIELAQAQRFKLFEYQRIGWTYHAKGLWYYLPQSYLPDLTLIGSSNFGERSVNRDLESQICLVTVNEELRRQLQREYVNLRRHCTPAEDELQSRSIPKWVQTVVVYFRNYF